MPKGIGYGGKAPYMGVRRKPLRKKPTMSRGAKAAAGTGGARMRMTKRLLARTRRRGM